MLHPQFPILRLHRLNPSEHNIAILGFSRFVMESAVHCLVDRATNRFACAVDAGREGFDVVADF